MEKRRKGTLIIVRRILTEPKMALTGVMLEISFPRFRASIATFNEERASGRFGLASMFETRSGRERKAWRAGCEERPGHPNPAILPQLCHSVTGEESCINCIRLTDIRVPHFP